MINRSNGWGFAMLALSWTAAGCADHVKSAVVTCPCDRGICCASGVCADDESACEAATQALSSASVGRWTGYIENYAFPSGSDALDLTLRVEADGSLGGELVLGQGPPPAPPTDRMVAWPPELIGVTTYFGPDPVEGVTYHLLNVEWTALRLRFDLNLDEPWAPWCRLQTSYDTNDFGGQSPYWPRWACTPYRSIVSQGDQCLQGFSADPYAPLVVVDCGWYALCFNHDLCACTADGCDAGTKLGISFDIALRGDEGNGSETYPSTGGHNVRLIRASH